VIKERLKELNMILPPCPKAVGVYRPFLMEGDTIYLSGVLPKDADGQLQTGKVGHEVSIEKAQEAAQHCAMNALSILEEACGLDHIEQIVRVVVYVQSEPDFYEQHIVANGASEVFASVLAEAGSHARSAVGVAALPLNATVEVEVTAKKK